MMMSGLAVTLEQDAAEAESALAAIRTVCCFTVGDQEGRRLAVALEADDPSESKYWHDWLLNQPGVADAEVVFVHWDAEDAEVLHAGA